MKRLLVLPLFFLCSSGVLAASNASQKPSVKETRELMASVCSSGVKTGVCKPCPGFLDSAGFQDEFALETVIYGKFTSAKFTDAILDFSGCEAHVSNFGGSVLLRWQGLTRWKFVKYVQGYRTGDCLKYPAKDGRDLLMCETGYAGMGTVITNLLLEDFSQSEPITQQLFSTVDSSGACSESGSAQELLEWKQVQLNADRYPDLRATLKSAVYSRRGATPDAPCEGQLFTGPSRTFTLEYTFDGVKFTPTQTTRGLIMQLLKDNPYLLGDGW